MTDLDPWRLPRTVLPRRYDLRLAPDLDAAVFSGDVRITADVAESCATILLNSKDLGVSRVLVDGREVRWSLDEPTERLVIVAPAPLAAGTTCVIDVAFDGVLNDKLRGFYRSTYLDESGNRRVIATTQMQSTDCRAAFPCFDEPDMKAVFGVTLDVDDTLLAISNSEEVSRVPLGDARTRITFADTIPMSTYLVAFVVGPLETTAPVRVGHVDLRVVHVPGKSHLARYGLRAAAFALDWFQRYYGIDYPGPKIDLVALPDFAAGAMENLGCITFREVLLLADPETSTHEEKQWLVDVVAHELSHMWFGDMVTMRWWNGIWLNEAFATFMQVAATDAFEPAWRRWTSFAVERTAAFAVDSLASTRPVEFEVRSPADSEGMFDVLTYEKGGSLLRMLEQWVGPERFRQGVGAYLARHMYANTDTGDLWDAIDTTVNASSPERYPVREVMDSWIWQPGYPVVTASVDGDTLVLSQRRFSYGGDSGATTDGSTLWSVPVAVSVDGETRTVLLSEVSATLRLPRPEATVVVNAGGWGYFRVDYEPALLARLDGPVLAAMTELERYNLVDDTWNAFVAGRRSRGDLIALLGRLHGETSPVVWQAISMALTTMWHLGTDADLDEVARIVGELARPVLESLGWEAPAGEDDRRSALRGQIVGLLGVQGRDESVVARCRAVVADGVPAHPEVTAAAILVTAANGDADVYELYLRRLAGAATPQEEERYREALAMFPDAALVERTVDMAFGDRLRAQDAPFVLGRCIANRSHGTLAWRLVRDRWAEANARFPVNSIIRIVQPVRFLAAPDLVEDVQAFFARHPIPQAAKMLEQALERQRVNAAFRAREFVSG